MSGKEQKGFLGRLLKRDKKEPVGQGKDRAKGKHPPDDVLPQQGKGLSQEEQYGDLIELWKEYSDPLYEPVNVKDLFRERNLFLEDMENEGMSKEAWEREPEEPSRPSGEPDEPSQPLDEPEELLAIEPVDAKATIRVSRDGMLAWAYLVPPRNGGRELEFGDILGAMLSAGVKEGVDEQQVERIAREKLYYQVLVVAKGCPVKNGVDGSVKDHFSRVITPQFLEDEIGQVDFKEHNWLQLAKEGDVIAEIFPAILPIDGVTVMGKPIQSKIKGKPAPIPQGANTEVSEDGLLLLAAQAGHVTCVGGKFKVAEILKIDRDVDNGTGNLRFNGDIAVEGDVRNGFVLEAEGSIIIKGSVESAMIKAGGNITVGIGIIGSGHATLTAGGDISCKYMESAVANAKGGVYAESMLWSQVFGQKEVNVTKGRGVIIGGTIVSCGHIEANVIGSQSRRMIEMNLREAESASMDQQKAYEKELLQLKHNLGELNKNILFLQTGRNKGKQEMLEQLVIARDTLQPREAELIELIKDAKADHGGLSECRIYCNALFPLAKIQIGDAVLLVNEEHRNCNIFYNSEGEIIIGSK